MQLMTKNLELGQAVCMSIPHTSRDATNPIIVKFYANRSLCLALFTNIIHSEVEHTGNESSLMLNINSCISQL